MLLSYMDYSTKKGRMQERVQSTYFNEEFGRSDFEKLDERMKVRAIRYIMKYIEKSGERIVYSKGLAQYFITDVIGEDVVCRIGQEEKKKLLLYDNFSCWDRGEYVGVVSPTVIHYLRKSD